MNQLLKVKCPQCDTVFLYYSSKFRPFCCERCKMIDLGRWFEESYKVPENEFVKLDKNINEKIENKQKSKTSQKNGTEISSDDYGDYTKIDEDDCDQNDY